MQDRNFDDIAEHFAAKIYHGTKPKGRLRQAVIWRDLEECIPDLHATSRSIIDIGAGLGQFVITLADMGHHVIYNDISEVMRDKAQQAAATSLSNDVMARIDWHAKPYQELPIAPSDLLLCHAVIEWLAEPEKLLDNLARRLRAGGYVSLCYYNPVGYTFRNLIAGNFNLLDRTRAAPDSGSLTPMNPSSSEHIDEWLAQAGFDVIKQSGIRVFSDYTLVKRGGLTDEEAVIERELLYSDQAPFNQIGRYIHIIAKYSKS